MVYSAGAINTPDPVVTEAWRRQALWFVIAVVGFTVVSRVPLRWWEWSAIPAYAFALVLLAATLVIGTGGTGHGGGHQELDRSRLRPLPAPPNLPRSRPYSPWRGSSRPRTSHPLAFATCSRRAFWSRFPSAWSSCKATWARAWRLSGSSLRCCTGRERGCAPLARDEPGAWARFRVRHPRLVGVHRRPSSGPLPLSLPPLSVRVRGGCRHKHCGRRNRFPAVAFPQASSAESIARLP